MALIKCPECEREISDKVASCPHCGYPFSTGNLNEGETPIPVEVTSVKLGTSDPSKKKKRVSIVIGGVAIVAIAVSVVLFVQHQNAASARTAYIENLHSVRALMLKGGAEAESLCGLTYAVWYNTIFEEYDLETDEYTQTSFGTFHSDFNDSIRALYADESTMATIASIELNQADVDELMRSLQNPTEEFAACYDTLNSMYDAYKGLTGLAISPSGNLNSFSDNFGRYGSNFMDYYEKIETQIPEV